MIASHYYRGVERSKACVHRSEDFWPQFVLYNFHLISVVLHFPFKKIIDKHNFTIFKISNKNSVLHYIFSCQVVFDDAIKRPKIQCPNKSIKVNTIVIHTHTHI